MKNKKKEENKNRRIARQKTNKQTMVLNHARGTCYSQGHQLLNTDNT